MGMGVDIRCIRQIIHVGPPHTVRKYFQETGRAGRDGQQANALLYYNNRDIAKNREGISDEIRAYCQLNDSCLREFLLRCFNVGKAQTTWLVTSAAVIADCIVSVQNVQHTSNSQITLNSLNASKEFRIGTSVNKLNIVNLS